MFLCNTSVQIMWLVEHEKGVLFSCYDVSGVLFVNLKKGKESFDWMQLKKSMLKITSR